jgi:micrococcal nuclease
MILAAALLSICPAAGVRVTCVHDGDSFIVDRERIRIMDIDAPELEGQCASERALAIRARNRLRELLVGYEIHRDGQDRYGRTLAVVTVNGRSVGAQLVREGLARNWTGRRESWCS